MNPRLLTASLALLLAACDVPGLGPDPRMLQREAEGRAIGGACRQALRGIEDCYSLNEKAAKTSIYEGWKEMDAYMRENKLEGQRPLYGKDAERQAQAAKPAEAKEEIIEEAKPAAAGKDGKTRLAEKAGGPGTAKH